MNAWVCKKINKQLCNKFFRGWEKHPLSARHCGLCVETLKVRILRQAVCLWNLHIHAYACYFLLFERSMCMLRSGKISWLVCQLCCSIVPQYLYVFDRLGLWPLQSLWVQGRQHKSMCNFVPLSTNLDNNKCTSQQQYNEARYIKIRASWAATNQVIKMLCILSIGLNVDCCLWIRICSLSSQKYNQSITWGQTSVDVLCPLNLSMKVLWFWEDNKVTIQGNPLIDDCMLRTKDKVRRTSHHQAESIAWCLSPLVHDDVRVIIRGNPLLHDCMPRTRDNVRHPSTYQREFTA